LSSTKWLKFFVSCTQGGEGGTIYPGTGSQGGNLPVPYISGTGGGSQGGTFHPGQSCPGGQCEGRTLNPFYP